MIGLLSLAPAFLLGSELTELYVAQRVLGGVLNQLFEVFLGSGGVTFIILCGGMEEIAFRRTRGDFAKLRGDGFRGFPTGPARVRFGWDGDLSSGIRPRP